MPCQLVKDLPHVAPGWGCCKCKARSGNAVYNGEGRTVCKQCGHERCDESTLSAFVEENPEILAVLRPKDPKLALRLARDVQHLQKSGKLTEEELAVKWAEVLRAQGYRFMGLLKPKPKSKKQPTGSSIRRRAP